jgi:hypothetical protein
MADATFGEYDIGEGGLLRRFEVVAHLTSLPLQIAVVLAVTWLPVMVLGIVSELRGHPEHLLYDAALHVRLLVAAPLFLFLDQLFPPLCRRMLKQLVAQGFVPDMACPRFERIVRSARRMGDSPLPELFLALLCIGLGVAAVFGYVSATGLTRRGTASAAQVWYALTDWPLFQFLLWRSLWRWVIWVRILVGLSRIPLDLVPTHGDRRGGIAFLRTPSVGYCAALLFAVSSVLCVEWREQFTVSPSLMSFLPFLGLFFLVGTAIALGPLLLFLPRLLIVRRRGLEQYSVLNADYCRQFERRWVDARERTTMLGTTDAAPLADLAANFHDNVDGLNVLLVYRRDLWVLLAVTLMPMVPIILASVPGEDWGELLGLFSGGVLRR